MVTSTATPLIMLHLTDRIYYYFHLISVLISRETYQVVYSILISGYLCVAPSPAIGVGTIRTKAMITAFGLTRTTVITFTVVLTAVKLICSVNDRSVY